MAAILASAVKNEPEDLTGHHRRDPDLQQHKKDHLGTSDGGEMPVVVSTQDGHVAVLASGQQQQSHVADLSSNNDNNNSSGPFSVVSATDTLTTAAPPPPSSSVPPTSTPAYTTTTDFFDTRPSAQPQFAPGSGDPDLYHPVVTEFNPGGVPHSPVSSTAVVRASSDLQYVHYYKNSGAGGPPGAGPPPPHINSPDSGIGDPNNSGIVPGSAGGNNHEGAGAVSAPFETYPHEFLGDVNAAAAAAAAAVAARNRPWQDFGRQNEEKIHIPKIFSPYGFR